MKRFALSRKLDLFAALVGVARADLIDALAAGVGVGAFLMFEDEVEDSLALGADIDAWLRRDEVEVGDELLAGDLFTGVLEPVAATTVEPTVAGANHDEARLREADFSDSWDDSPAEQSMAMCSEWEIGKMSWSSAA